jgi:tetratricopeptide (TPR) repeat protein
MIGILEDSRGNVAEAERNYRSALEYAPESPIAANNLAWLLADNGGNLDEALRLASSAVARDPKVADYYDTLGWVYLKKNLFPTAATQFRKAIEIAEKAGRQPDPGYRVRLQMALASAGERAAAGREAGTSFRKQQILSQQELAEGQTVPAAQ